MRTRNGERLLLAALFGLVPLLFILIVLLPSRKRMHARQARMDAIYQRLQALPVIQPITPRERHQVEDPQAAWRTRIPLLKSDSDRFAHYHLVVSDLKGEWARHGVPLLSLRASWDALDGSFSLPGVLGNPDLGLPREWTTSAGQLQGWVLEARVGGVPERLFEAMAVLPNINPLLEPVGIRWESVPEHTRQSLLLRNLILAP